MVTIFKLLEEGRSMIISYLRFALIVACFSLVSCHNTPKLAPLPSDAVVLAFGDSITFGTGAAPGESYPSILESVIGRRVVNAGVPGEVTAQGKERLGEVLDQHRPALMLLCLGGNDFLRNQDQSQTAANLRDMVTLAQQRGVAVVLIAVPRLGFGLEVPKLYRQIATEFELPLEEQSLQEILSTNRLKSDLIHPNALGYRSLARSVAKVLVDTGAI